MLIRRSNEIPSSEITPKSAYLNRRAFMAGAVVAGMASGAGVGAVVDVAEAAVGALASGFGAGPDWPETEAAKTNTPRMTRIKHLSEDLSPAPE